MRAMELIDEFFTDDCFPGEIEDLPDHLVAKSAEWASASSALVRHLIDQVVSPETPERPDVLDLIHAVAVAASRIDASRLAEDWPVAWADAVEALVGLLDDRAWSVRCRTVHALSVHKDTDGSVCQALIARLPRETNSFARVELMGAIGKLSGQAALPLLDELMTDPSPWVRMVAAGTACAVSGEVTPERLDQIVAAFPTDPKQSRNYPGIGRLVPWLMECTAGDPAGQDRLVQEIAAAMPKQDLALDAVQAKALQLARSRSATHSLVPSLAGFLSVGQARVRAIAAEMLACVGPAAGAYADELAELFRDRTELPRCGGARVDDFAMWALTRLGDRRCVGALRERFSEPLPEFAMTIPSAGYRHWPPPLSVMIEDVPQFAAELVPVLRDNLGRGDYRCRAGMARLLVTWGPAARVVEDVLISFLHDGVEAWCADALAGIGTDDVSAIGLLADAAADDGHPNLSTRCAAATAHARLTQDFGLANHVLGLALTGTQWEQRQAVRRTGELGSAAAEHVGVLRALLFEEDKWLRLDAAHALYLVTGEVAEIPVEIAADPTVSFRNAVRRTAIRYLADMKPLPAKVEPALRQLLASDERWSGHGGWRLFRHDEQIRRHARQALANIS